MTYKAFDGKEFTTERECLDYERSFEKKKYEETFVDPPLKARADFVMDAYLTYAHDKSLDDDYIADKDRPTRYGDAVFCGDFSYGISYLRDDAVDILIDYIRILENEVHRLENELEENK
nr:MAG TPA: Protein of unknown function (DUF1192) [Inoviridae sp.]